ncbi:nitrate reductase [Mangrovibacterium lignilyticum]|uniref:nitrate reductase n=1 Tax=Mangrovibacterium lignilyticum TaxID=2668052 RepID=UPI0013D03B78|nr:nitrate reductase [Mangrovibacterium lignilyticum]
MMAGEYKSTCSYCGVGCGIIVTKQADGKVSVKGDREHPVNRGKLCSKGLNLHYVVNNQNDRLLYPQMRLAKGYPLQKVEWPEAINRVATAFKSLIQKFGPDSVAFYVSGQCLTEEYYVASKLAKGFWGTNNIDTNSRLCMSSAVVGYKMQLGEDAVPASYEDIDLADCFFITGANPAWCHPILFRRIEARKNENPNVKIVVADPRRTQSCELADLHLQLKPGTDVYLNNAIGRCLLENGFADWDFIREHTNGIDDYQKQVTALTVEEAAEICGVPEADIRLAAKYIGEAKGFISMWAMGLNQSVIGVNKNLSLINLSLITGQIGKPGSGPFSLTGQPNAMGGREVGGMCNLLPAHRNLDNEAHRREVAQFWNVADVPAKPGYSATEMIDALESGKLKAVWVICTNPMVSLPNSNKVEAALKKAKMVVVQDISSKSDTVPFADVVLPAAGWLEKEGTMTNSERRITYISQAVKAPGEALPDYEIICRVARKMGYPGFNFKNAEEVFNEYKQLTIGTSLSIEELSYGHLQQTGSEQWPFKNGKGTARLFEDKKFYTPTQKANIFAVAPKNDSELPSSEFPFVLTTGRIRDQWHTMTRTGKVKRLKQHIDRPFLEIHPADAEKLGIEADDIVVIKNKNGQVQAPAKVTDEIRHGVVFLPMHWGKVLSGNNARANNLTTDLVDPKSKEPDFKYSTVSVEKYRKTTERLIVVGAGAAALQFVRSYRERNKTDEILVISKEIHPFYNRVLLPDYIAGSMSWEALQKTSDEEITKLNIQVETGVSLTRMETDSKTIWCSNGKSHTYGKLILATGSSPNVSNSEWMKFPSTYTIRSRFDADGFRSEVEAGQKVLVVGGGLLGLEMAASMLELDVQVTLVNRNPRLMDRQLDNESATLLKDILQEKGVQILFNDELSLLAYDPEQKHRVSFKSGKRLTFDAVVFAIGTKPNIEFAKGKVDTRRGIIVNKHLQTSQKDIYAIGEIAELNGNLFGITAAAEEQAATLANHLLGNPMSQYHGTVPMNILKFPGIDLCSVGMTSIPDGSKAYEEVVFIDKAARYYKKCIVKDDVLMGAILMGDKAEFAEFKKLIVQKTELAGLRNKLLRTGKPVEPVIGKLLCSCNNVGAGNIQKAIRSGATQVDAICEQTGAGLGCGSCRPEIQKILKEEVEPVTATN